MQPTARFVVDIWEGKKLAVSQVTPSENVISVVIPHLNQPGMLERCLHSLFAGRRKPDEVIVVDNGSTAMPSDIVASYSGVVLVQELAKGPGPARNLGVSLSKGNILAFIDADCLADPDWLFKAEDALLEDDVMIFGGDVRIACVDAAHPTIIEAYESVYAYRMDRYIAREGFTGTGNLVVRRQVLDAVGPFASLGVAEDRDWGQRATGLGYTIRYVASMRVYHPARRNFEELKAKWRRHIAHDFANVHQRPKKRLRFLIKTILMPFSPLAEIPNLLLTDRISGIRSRVFAFVALVRIRWFRAIVMAGLLAGWDVSRSLQDWNRN